jgi:hypothetical protein
MPAVRCEAATLVRPRVVDASAQDAIFRRLTAVVAATAGDFGGGAFADATRTRPSSRARNRPR